MSYFYKQYVHLYFWNLVLNLDVDTENYRHINNPRARSEVLKLIDEDNYIDAFRFLHDSKGSTWKKINPEKKTSTFRLFPGQ